MISAVLTVQGPFAVLRRKARGRPSEQSLVTRFPAWLAAATPADRASPAP
ncbi:hypothetical protein [Streptomyces chartreusis]